MSDYAALTPINVVTGFLGSGKTTLLQGLLAAPELSDTAVLVNEFAPVMGGAGLHDHRVVLWGWGHVERTAHREVFTLVIEHVHLAFVVELSRRFIVRKGVRVPGVP